MEDGRSMTTFYDCSVYDQSCLQSNTFLKLSYREFLPYANFITANFITAVFQNYY